MHEQMIRNTLLISLTFYSLNSEIYAEDNKVQKLKKEMCHHLHMQIRCQYNILFGDKFLKLFLIIFIYKA